MSTTSTNPPRHPSLLVSSSYVLVHISDTRANGRSGTTSETTKTSVYSSVYGTNGTSLPLRIDPYSSHSPIECTWPLGYDIKSLSQSCCYYSSISSGLCWLCGSWSGESSLIGQCSDLCSDEIALWPPIWKMRGRMMRMKLRRRRRIRSRKLPAWRRSREARLVLCVIYTHVNTLCTYSILLSEIISGMEDWCPVRKPNIWSSGTVHSLPWIILSTFLLFSDYHLYIPP